MFKVPLLLALVVVVVGVATAQEAAPEPYSYSYETEGHEAAESNDPSGKVTGHYTLVDSDGRQRRVDYEADESGFHAKVKTNEVGTKSENPADVEIQSSPPTPEQMAQADSSSHQQSQSYQQAPSQYAQAQYAQAQYAQGQQSITPGWKGPHRNPTQQAQVQYEQGLSEVDKKYAEPYTGKGAVTGSPPNPSENVLYPLHSSYGYAPYGAPNYGSAAPIYGNVAPIYGNAAPIYGNAAPNYGNAAHGQQVYKLATGYNQYGLPSMPTMQYSNVGAPGVSNAVSKYQATVYQPVQPVHGSNVNEAYGKYQQQVKYSAQQPASSGYSSYYSASSSGNVQPPSGPAVHYSFSR